MNDNDGPRYGEEPVRRYLLGQLADEEAGRLEEEMLRDPRQFDLVEAIEAELLEALAQDTLPPAERELVRSRLAAAPRDPELLAALALDTLSPAERDLVCSRLAAAPRRHELLALEQGLGEWAHADDDAGEPVADEAVPPKVLPFEVPEAPSKPDGPTTVAPPASHWVRRLAAAAMVVLAVGLSSIGIREAITDRVVSVTMNPMAHRGTDAALQLSVPWNADRVDIHVHLGQAPGDAFQAVVKAGGREVWGPELLDVRTPPGQARGVTLEIDADDLPPGRYTLAVWQRGATVTANGAEGLVAYQEFEVVRP